jgi:hypothetical protein
VVCLTHLCQGLCGLRRDEEGLNLARSTIERSRRDRMDSSAQLLAYLTLSLTFLGRLDEAEQAMQPIGLVRRLRFRALESPSTRSQPRAEKPRPSRRLELGRRDVPSIEGRRAYRWGGQPGSQLTKVAMERYTRSRESPTRPTAVGLGIAVLKWSRLSTVG